MFAVSPGPNFSEKEFKSLILKSNNSQTLPCLRSPNSAKCKFRGATAQKI